MPPPDNNSCKVSLDFSSGGAKSVTLCHALLCRGKRLKATGERDRHEIAPPECRGTLGRSRCLHRSPQPLVNAFFFQLHPRL